MHAASKGIKDFDNDIFDDFKKETVRTCHVVRRAYVAGQKKLKWMR
tara:strand:+ start:974 stop:1111 length:138 start_codon:yes stop_codon:yes gene_type:complete